MSDQPILPDVETTENDLFTTSKGVVIKVQGINPMKLQLAQQSVKIPAKPTYDVVTATGKKETFDLDEESADSVEYGMQYLKRWETQRREKMDEQNNASIRAIFKLGCRIINWGDQVSGWEEDYAELGVEIPEKQRDREVFYLMHELSGKEFTDLLNRVMLKSGASEDDIKKAEESFRGPVPTGS